MAVKLRTRRYHETGRAALIEPHVLNDFDSVTATPMTGFDKKQMELSAKCPGLRR